MYTTTARPRDVLLSWSGGKDSALALQSLHGDPDWRVAGLITAVTREYDRISVHGVRRSLLEAQALSLGIPLHLIEIPAACTNEVYEGAFREGLAAAATRHPGCATIAFGDLFLQDVREYRERLLAGSSWTPLFPLWGTDTTTLAGRFIADGFLARIVCVDTRQLDAAMAGRAFDRDLLDDLPSSVDPCGERGEFHTFVSAGPGFRSPVAYAVGERILRDERFMFCDLLG